jgi:hypothetical protein
MRIKYKLGILLVIIIAIIAARVSTVLLLRFSGISVGLNYRNAGY